MKTFLMILLLVFTMSESGNLEAFLVSRNSLSIMAFVVCACLLFLYLAWKQKRRWERFNSEKRCLDDAVKRFRKEKDDEIEKLHQVLAVYRGEHQHAAQWNAEQALLSSQIVSEMHRHAVKVQLPSATEWEDLRAVVARAVPEFYRQITSEKYRLTEQEIDLCILVRLRFVPSEIAVLFNLTRQRITNMRSSVSEKMFHVSGAKSLDAMIRRL